MAMVLQVSFRVWILGCPAYLHIEALAGLVDLTQIAEVVLAHDHQLLLLHRRHAQLLHSRTTSASCFQPLITTFLLVALVALARSVHALGRITDLQDLVPLVALAQALDAGEMRHVAAHQLEHLDTLRTHGVLTHAAPTTHELRQRLHHFWVHTLTCSCSHSDVRILAFVALPQD